MRMRKKEANKAAAMEEECGGRELLSPSPFLLPRSH